MLCAHSFTKSHPTIPTTSYFHFCAVVRFNTLSTMTVDQYEAHDATRSLTRRASDVFDEITFNTKSLYNEEAPEPLVAFIIASVLCAAALVFYVRRVLRIKEGLKGFKFNGALRLRVLISAAIDTDETFFTVLKFATQSFYFLGALQINYQIAFIIMLVFFALESFLDALRILIAFFEATSLADYTAVSRSIKRKARNKTQLDPTNVYEDLTRERTVVAMVFITQGILISFIVVDVFDTETHSCHDGTSGCPVVGTLGSYVFYCLGIFMASVFLVGPKTQFGQSEQNPAFWIKLLLMAKPRGSSVTWYDPESDQILSFDLKKHDWRLWSRFMMSILINGVGFHILVHALPIQVASQSSLTGVVFRAVGMMYLVDLDDTPGYKMTLVEHEESEEEKQEAESAAPALGTIEEGKPSSVQDMEEAPRPVVPVIPSAARLPSQGILQVSSMHMLNDMGVSMASGVGSGSDRFSGRTNGSNLSGSNVDNLDVSDHDEEFAVLTEKIVDDAKLKLDALMAGRKDGTLTATGALAVASGLTTAPLVGKQSVQDVTQFEDGDGDQGGSSNRSIAINVPDATPDVASNDEQV